MGYINLQQMRKQLKTSLTSLAPLARNNARQIFYSKKQRILGEFRRLKISQEIIEGPEGESGLLNYGNLFSFLGFNKGDKPVDELITFLRANIQIDEKVPIINYSNGVINYSFTVSSPTEEDIESVTPLEWDRNRSWLREIEDGASGFSFYIFKKYFDKSTGSRSTTGLQSKRGVRSGEFGPRPYLSTLMSFIKREFND